VVEHLADPAYERSIGPSPEGYLQKTYEKFLKGVLKEEVIEQYAVDDDHEEAARIDNEFKYK
jgi:hypothetical protein